MCTDNFTITKRDGKKEKFSLDKIKSAILKAFSAVGQPIDNDGLQKVMEHLRFCNGMSVEDIQNQVEVALMAERHFKVAKTFMLYRKQHEDDRETAEKLSFLFRYVDAENPATGSKFDANANVENKNIATLIGELPKQGFIRLNRRLITDRLKQMYSKELSDRYLYLLNNHFIYKNDETSLANYCASITMYPWLLSGTRSIGGNSTAPTNLKSFCGGFVNMVFIVSSMLSGACATPEFLMYMSYFLQKEYGDDFYARADQQADLSLKSRTIDKVITDCFEQIVYSINQPTGARNFQSVFWNISYYDKNYFESIFGEFFFPDGSKPSWPAVSWLQKRFMRWFNQERTKCVLTFPVETMALLTKDGEVIDKEYGDFTAEMYAEGHSFFTYMSDNADSLASCCRLRNEIQDNGFSYTLGAGGVSTGSKSVLTININRCVQQATREGIHYTDYLEPIIDLVHKVQLAYNENLKALQEKGMLPLFDAGYINIKRQYLTVGVNGMVEAAESLGITISDNPEYEAFIGDILGLIDSRRERGREARTLGSRSWLLRAARLLQQLLLHRRRYQHRPHSEVPPPRTPLYRAPDGWQRPAHEPRRAPLKGTVPPASAHCCTRGLQLLHLQHSQHAVQRLWTHRQAIPEGMSPLPQQERGLSHAYHWLSEARLKLLSRPPKGSQPPLLCTCGGVRTNLL